MGRRDLQVASSAAESPPPMTAKGLFLGQVLSTTRESVSVRPIPIPKYRNCTIADRTSTDSTLPIRLLALQSQPLCTRTGGDDNRISRFWFLVLLEFSPVSERTSGKIDFGNGLGDDFCAKSERLSTEFIHELRTENSGGEPREVLNCKNRLC